MTTTATAPKLVTDNDLFDQVDFNECDTPADQVSHAAVETLLDKYKTTGKSLPHPDFLARQAITIINAAIERENMDRLKRKIARRIKQGQDATKVKLGNDERLYNYRELSPPLIAQILLRTHHIINIAPTGQLSNPDFDMLAIYDDDPTSDSYGTYLVNENAVNIFARQYNKELTINEMKEVMFTLKTEAPRRQRDTDRDLIAVANGIVNYRTKELEPFSPDVIFLSKAGVNYNPDAKNPICHNDADGTDWDVESWMHELTDDPDMTELLWQVVGATIRPYVSWNKSAWFYSEQGNNGKGSLVELMRQIVGPMSYTSIPLTDFSKEFALEPLTQASAILVDENDVGTFIDKAANLKAIITGDVISINRKFRTPISYQFHGFMVQCLNEFPKIKDKSESFYRRQLFIPFNKCFTGAERKYIKDDYLRRTEVLEYALWRVINMEDYYSFIEPEATKIILDEYKDFNDPVRAFWNELGDEFVWSLLPYTFLYDVYKKWMEESMPSSSPLGRNTFIKDINSSCARSAGAVFDEYLSGDTTYDEISEQWVALGSQTRMRSAGLMDDPEPLIATYDLTGWMNPAAPAKSNGSLIPLAKSHYAGIARAGEWLRSRLSDKVVDQIEATRATQPLAVFAFDPVSGDVRYDAQATQDRIDAEKNTVTPLFAASTTASAADPDTTAPQAPRYAPSPVTPRQKPSAVTVVDGEKTQSQAAPETGGEAGAEPDENIFDPDTDLDVNFRPIHAPSNNDADSAADNATNSTAADNESGKVDDTAPTDAAPEDAYPVIDESNILSEDNPEMPVADFTPINMADVLARKNRAAKHTASAANADDSGQTTSKASTDGRRAPETGAEGEGDAEIISAEETSSDNENS